MRSFHRINEPGQYARLFITVLLEIQGVPKVLYLQSETFLVAYLKPT